MPNLFHHSLPVLAFSRCQHSRMFLFRGTTARAKASAPSSAAAPDRLTLRLRVLEMAASTTAAFASTNEPGKVKASDPFPH